MYSNYDEEYYKDNTPSLPHECPKCGERLELDVNYGATKGTYTSQLLCNNCDFELDVTEELKEFEWFENN